MPTITSSRPNFQCVRKFALDAEAAHSQRSDTPFGTSEMILSEPIFSMANARRLCEVVIDTSAVVAKIQFSQRESRKSRQCHTLRMRRQRAAGPVTNCTRELFAWTRSILCLLRSPIIFYHVWLRVLWGGPCNNSVTLALVPDGTPHETVEGLGRHLIGNDLEFHRWHWIRGPSLQVMASECELLLGTREDDVSVDSIVLATDSKYIPPNEPPTNTSSLDDLHSRRSLRFSDNFCSAPSGQSRLPAGWSTDEPFWRSFRYDGVSSIGPIRAGVTVARAQHVVLQNLSIDCAFSLTPQTGAGIVFGQTGEGDNFVARVASHHASKPYAAQLEVGIQRPDEFETLQSVSCDLGCDEWHVMRVRMWGRFCQISLGGTPRLSLRLQMCRKVMRACMSMGLIPCFLRRNHSHRSLSLRMKLPRS